MSEQFRPLEHRPPDTLVDRLRFYTRLVLDFQVCTVYRDMKGFLPALAGIVLDIGAGKSPYRHLVNRDAAEYRGIDIQDSADFGYVNQEIDHFDGRHLPYETGSVNHFICTEVLEHVEDPQVLVNEMHRVLQVRGRGIVTVPWSARFHYIPYDYHRFTPTRLKALFAAFSSVVVRPRGTDITVIASKIVVAYARLLTPGERKVWPLDLVLAILLAPLVIPCVLLGHLSLATHLGSSDDPLGYTVWLEK